MSEPYSFFQDYDALYKELQSVVEKLTTIQSFRHDKIFPL